MVEMLRIFLCHSKGDKQHARVLYHRLLNDGFSPWLDEESLLPGQDWDREIRLAVRSSHAVVVLLSCSSVNKEGYVQKEIGFALDVADEKPEGLIFLIPVRLEKCDVPYRLRRWHWLDLFNSDGYERLKTALAERSANLKVAETPIEAGAKKQASPPTFSNTPSASVVAATRMLRSRIRQTREDGLEVLVGNTAIDELIKALSSRPEVSEAAAKGLSRVRDSRALPYLFDGLGHTGIRKKYPLIPNVEHCFKEWGDTGLEALLRPLPDYFEWCDKERWRIAAASCLNKDNISIVLKYARKSTDTKYELLHIILESGLPLSQHQLLPILKQLERSSSGLDNLLDSFPKSSVGGKKWWHSFIRERLTDHCLNPPDRYRGNLSSAIRKAFRLGICSSEYMRDLSQRVSDNDIQKALLETAEKIQRVVPDDN